MKKIVILLSFVLSAFIISSCAENNPNNPSDNSNNITLAERAGTYSGEMNNLIPLVIVLDSNAQVTSIKMGGTESITEPIVIKEGASYKGTTIAPFDATISGGATATVRIEFKSGTDASQGATAYVTLPNAQSETPVELTYSK